MRWLVRGRGKGYKKKAGRIVQPALQLRPFHGGHDLSNSKRPSTNGKASKPAEPKKPRKPRPRPSPLPPPPPPPPPVPAPLTSGVVLSTLKHRPLVWFLPPWIPRGMLSCVAGRPNTGKSSFLGWLLAQSKRSVLFPGFEEVLEMLMLPRFIAHGVALDNVLCLNDQRYCFIDQKSLLVRQIRAWRAELVVIETVDSYLPSTMNENDGQAVRLFLESIEAIAEATGAAIVCSRHPGKDADNVMPGSRAWGAVPRVVLELVRDDGPPLKRYLRPFKYGIGPEPSSQSFDLVETLGQPPVFRFGKQAGRGAVDLARDVPDALDRSFVQMAEQMLTAFLADSEKEGSLVLAEGRKEGWSERTIYRAANSLGVVVTRSGKGREHRSFWSLPGVTPGLDAQGVGHTPPCAHGPKFHSTVPLPVLDHRNWRTSSTQAR